MTEQDVKNQIAEMRGALASVHASQRKAGIVRILGVVVGLGVVAIYVFLFFDLARGLIEEPEGGGSPPLVSAIQGRVERLNLPKIPKALMDEAAPVFWSEIRGLLAELPWQEAVETEVRALVRDLAPIAEEQLEIASAEIEALAKTQGEDLLAELQTMLEERLSSRIGQMIRQQETRLATGTRLSEEQLGELLLNVIEANQNALKSAIDKRWGENDEEVKAIIEMLQRFPQLPEPMTALELQRELGLALLARLGHRLVGVYEVRDLD
jgi:hypothetical protein